MTPLERAARDKLALLLDPDTARFPTLDFQPGSRNPTCEEVYALIVQHDEMVRSMIAPDLRLVLAALDRHETIAEAVLETARQVAAHAGRFRPVPERVEVTYQAAATGRELCNAALSHTSGRIRCQLAVSSPLPEGYLEHGGRYTGNRNHWEKHWHEDEHGQVRTWTDNETEGA